jgi:DnaJ-class molecular chaperone
MGTHTNFYQTLGLLQQVDDVVIKAAYKALAQKHHPDKYKTNKELHTQIMADLNAAYAAIGTKSKRKAYDESLKRASEVKPKKSKTPATSHSELIEKLEMSAVDEMVVVTLYEQYFSTRVVINSGWVNTYSIKQGNAKVTLGFTELKARIIEKLKQQ